MKLKVLKSFRDKNTGKKYEVGEQIEVDDGRGAELLEHPMGLVEEVKAKARKKSKSK